MKFLSKIVAIAGAVGIVMSAKAQTNTNIATYHLITSAELSNYVTAVVAGLNLTNTNFVQNLNGRATNLTATNTTLNNVTATGSITFSPGSSSSLVIASSATAPNVLGYGSFHTGTGGGFYADNLGLFGYKSMAANSCPIGQVTLNGTNIVPVAYTNLFSVDTVALLRCSSNGVMGFPYVNAQTNGVGFGVASTATTDTGVLMYIVFHGD